MQHSRLDRHKWLLLKGDRLKCCYYFFLANLLASADGML